MAYTVDVDIGGTFTDFFGSRDDGELVLAKSPTTHYDLSVGFLRGLRELAKGFRIPLRQFLTSCDDIRYCTTIGTNALLERTGPKLGLITTAGFEDTIAIGRARSWADGLSGNENKDLGRIVKPKPLIPRDMIVGLRERVDSAGNVVMPLKPADVLEKLQYLVEKGAMGYVVCLLWSCYNPVHEQLVKEIVEEEYPEDYLGSMPVFLSHSISPKMGEYTRFTTTIVNAYIHNVMGEELARLIWELKDNGYKKPLILVQNVGGMKKVTRTRAVLTYNAGPVSGLHGSKFIGELYGTGNVIFTDMGGTSYDIGVVSEGEIRTYDFIPVIDRWRTNIPAIEVKSIGAGGGSIAWINTVLGDRLEVGPQSAGSMPGPACYDQGGTEPTVTDADVILGYINPDNYLGGKMKLKRELAEKAILEKVAKPLGIGVLEAAARIRKIVDAKMGQEVFNEVVLKGYDPREFVLLAGGGAGPSHALDIAPYIEAREVIMSPFSPVFGAFGASTIDVMQVFDRTKALKLYQYANQAYTTDYESFNEVVRELRDLALRDIKMEGYGEEDVIFRLELEMRYGMQYNYTKIECPHLEIHSMEDVRDICERFEDTYSQVYTPEAKFPQGGINVENFFLKAIVPTKHVEIVAEPLAGEEPSPEAMKEVRPVYFAEKEGVVDTTIYTYEGLRPGNVVVGPAIIAARDTTCVINPGWKLTMDKYRQGILRQIDGKASEAARRGS
jgi:N-methylhydantoinase A/acetophenone carboxylase